MSDCGPWASSETVTDFPRIFGAERAKLSYKKKLATESTSTTFRMPDVNIQDNEFVLCDLVSGSSCTKIRGRKKLEFTHTVTCPSDSLSVNWNDGKRKGIWCKPSNIGCVHKGGGEYHQCTTDCKVPAVASSQTPGNYTLPSPPPPTPTTSAAATMPPPAAAAPAPVVHATPPVPAPPPPDIIMPDFGPNDACSRYGRYKDGEWNISTTPLHVECQQDPVCEWTSERACIMAIEK